MSVLISAANPVSGRLPLIQFRSDDFLPDNVERVVTCIEPAQVTTGGVLWPLGSGRIR
jgi:hypothetical protein